MVRALPISRHVPIPAAKRGRSLSDVVYERILANIVSSDFVVNSRLPPEAELAKRFGVSRPVVREALARLRDDDVIVSQQGSGSYVKAKPAPVLLSFGLPTSIADMQRCFEFRLSIESEAAFQAANHRTKADLRALSASFEAREAVIARNDIGVEEDFAFHRTICVATQNRFFVETMDFLHDNITTGINFTRNLLLPRAAYRLGKVQSEHANILRAIDVGDGEAARRAMRTHLGSAKKRLFEGTDSNSKR